MTADKSEKTSGVKLRESGLALEELDLHGGVFWEEVLRFTDEAQLDDLVASALAGISGTLQWVFVDEMDHTAGRAVAALCVSRVLVSRGRSVLVLDGDDLRPDLTRWAGRFEREGWIDYLRYGASLDTSSIPLPWSGERGRLLGVGSFCPTQVMPEEVQRLLERLRYEADDVIVAAPMGPAGAPWLAAADVRVLCWDRMARSQVDTQALLAALAAGNTPALYLASFGGEGERVEVTDEGFVPTEEPVVTAAVEPEDVPVEEPVATPAVVWAGDIGERDSSPPEQEWHPRHLSTRSSPLFVRLAILLVFALVVIIVVWIGSSRQPGRSQDRALVPPPVTTDISSPAAGGAGQLAETPASQLETSRGRESGLGREPGSGDEPDPGDEPGAGRETSPGREPGARREAGIEQATGSGRGQLDASPMIPRETGAATIAAGGAAAPNPYRVAVGEAGWALHLYSLADSVAASRQLRVLERKGYRAVWRALELPDKGRWYRIYVGSFPTREAAVQARPELLARLGTDYALPFRF